MKLKIILLILSLLLITAVAFWFFYLKDCRERRLISEGNQLVQQIELYKKQQGSFPDSLELLGITESESDELFYKKIDDSSYKIYFHEGFDLTHSYSSRDKIWIEKYQ